MRAAAIFLRTEVSCPASIDHIDPRRSALFTTRLILRDVGADGEHADLSVQTGDDDAEDASPDLCAHRLVA